MPKRIQTLATRSERKLEKERVVTVRCDDAEIPVCLKEKHYPDAISRDVFGFMLVFDFRLPIGSKEQVNGAKKNPNIQADECNGKRVTRYP